MKGIDTLRPVEIKCFATGRNEFPEVKGIDTDAFSALSGLVGVEMSSPM